MAKQSLFSACKRVFRDGISGTYTVGNNDIFLELYSQQDIDQNNEIGNSSEENIVVVAGDTITIPEDYTLIPVKPKKSLVVICNTFVNNGTVSMYQKAPNVLPHDLFIIERQEFGGNKDVIIPAYAGNEKINNITKKSTYDVLEHNGSNGINRNCGSGGLGSSFWQSGNNNNLPGYGSKSGSGYAFGGGAGSGSGVLPWDGSTSTLISTTSVDSTYPMHGGDAYKPVGYYYCSGGVGNPKGNNSSVSTYGQFVDNNFGCGGRIIIFCNSFTNNGIINVNGTSANVVKYDTGGVNNAYGGASGAGAVDLFYTTILSQGTITAEGGQGGLIATNTTQNNWYVGAGGDGSITLTPWAKSSVLKPIAKYMSKENMVYFLTNYIERLKQGED